MMPHFQDNRFPSEDPPYKDLWQKKWGSYTAVSYRHYRELRDEGRLPDEHILLFREPGAMFFRPPAPTLSISAVKTVFSVAPDSVGASLNDNNDDDDPYIVVPKKAIRAAKQQVRAAREALRALDPYVRASAVSSSPAETEIKKKIPGDGFKTSIKSASEPPSPQTAKHTCRKCEASFRSRNALFDHIYSNTCKPSLETPRKSSNQQSSIITSNYTPTSKTTLETPIRVASSTPDSQLNRRLASYSTSASPAPPGAPDSSGLFTPVRSRPATAWESPIEWEFDHSPPMDSSPPFTSAAVIALSPRSRSVTTAVKHKESSQLSAPGTRCQPSTPDGSYGNNKLDSFKQPSTPSTPSTPHSCRTCNKSFASRNLLFSHLHDHNHCRPDKLSKKMLPSNVGKPFLIQNASWRTGKVTMDFGVLGDIMSKLAAVASAA